MPGRLAKRILLTGGGTSGHVNPALAMGQAFKARFDSAELLYVGVRGRAEEIIVPKAGLPIKFVPSAGYAPPRRLPAFLRFAAKLSLGCLKAVFILLSFRPDYILATGGYVAAPVIFAHSLLARLGLSKAVVVLHEANAVPGRMNALMAPRVDHLFLTFPHTRGNGERARGVVAGYPVRNTLERIGRDQAREKLGLPKGRKVVLIFGGSQGARSINKAVVGALKSFLEHPDPPFILHGAGLGSKTHHPLQETIRLLENTLGPDWAQRTREIYRLETYLHDMAAAYSAADLVVCRAGAGAIHEVSSLGVPTLLIPKPNLPGDHQVENARALAAFGGAELCHEELLIENGRLVSGVGGPDLAARILALVADEARLQGLAARVGEFMAPGAARRIADLVIGSPENRPQIIPPAQDPLPASPSSQALLVWLTRAYRTEGPAYDPSRYIKDQDEMDYLRHRSAQLLISPDWSTRNTGVKLIGLLKDETRIKPLMLLLRDRTPAPFLHRLLGGDFQQVGFIRRNALISLILIDRCAPGLEEVVEAALTDPYYEVRVQAAKAVARFHDRFPGGPERFLEPLYARLRDRSFEVVQESALALGRIGGGQRTLEALLSLRINRYWQVRQAALRALIGMTREGLVEDPGRLLREVSGFVVLATDFRPQFTIKAAYAELVDCLSERIQKDG